jgi:chromatin segregation and condensation protein Rec8/ScpA/Scc1 (kleisin family)
VTVAVRTPGEVEDLAALTARAESAERERDSARAEVERLRATRSGGEALAAMQIERDELRAALREAVEIVEVAPPLTGDSVRDLAEYRRRFEIRARARAALKGET